MSEVPTSAEDALSRLREAILAGELSPGERLHQNDLAQRFGISRTPLRTALTALAQSGLVEYESNKGFRVSSQSGENIRDAFLVRAELEALACSLAASRLTPDEITAMRALLAEGDRLLEGSVLRPENLEPYRAMNVALHAAIITAAANPWLRRAIENLFNIPMLSDRVILWEDHAIILRSHDDHHRMVRALAQSDGARASAIMREHIIFSAEYLLDKPGLMAEPPTGQKPREAKRPGHRVLPDLHAEDNA